MTFDEAMDYAGREERFKATVYAVNTLLLAKGIYTSSEFETLFTEHIEAMKKREIDARAAAKARKP